ncbi:hypothetical protein BDD12DRAFT_824875 [Trichophaea hybrida]|nr:hypothetical protein BDD12DRAFT_824875 [Trichophaea hybrida]
MSATDVVSPTLDEMIFAISQVNSCTVYRPSSLPPPSMDCLSASLDNAPQLSLTKTSTNADTAIDDDTDDDEDDSEIDEDDDEENLGMASKDLVLLDLIALLLVTEAKSDVAATMLITNGSMKFFYSKNRPFTDSENKYVHTLFNYASQTDRNAVDRYEDLLAVIVDMCQKKIKARLSKLSQRVKELQSTPDRGIHFESCLPLEVVKILRAQLKRSKDPEFLRYAVASALAVGLPSKMNLMIDQKLLRRIRKLGDYLGAVIRLVREIDRLPPQTLQTIDIQEVRTQVTAIHTL